MTTYYAPDTNFFLHFKAARDIPWRQLTQDDVQLVVVEPVLEELDNFKHDGNKRRARRARAALTMLDPLIIGDVDDVVVREVNPKVSFVLASFQTSPGPLEERNTDCAIVNQVVLASSSNAPITILTNDRMMIRHARRAGAPVAMLADEWELEPEQNEQERENAALARQLSELRAALPKIDVMVRGQPTSVPVTAKVTWAEEIPAKAVAAAMERVKSAYPDEQCISGRITVTTQYASICYANARAQWLKDVQRQINRLPALINANFGTTEVLVGITNSGGASAEGLVIEFAAAGDIAVYDAIAHRDLAAKAVPCAALRHPPKLKDFGLEGAIENLRSGFTGQLPRLPVPPPKPSPRTFRWSTESREGCSVLIGQCDEFRHHMHMENYSLLVYPMPKEDSAAMVKGAIKVRVSSKNLTTTLEFTVKVKIDLQRRSALSDLEALLVLQG